MTNVGTLEWMADSKSVVFTQLDSLQRPYKVSGRFKVFLKCNYAAGHAPIQRLQQVLIALLSCA